jgi:hypothetical protein
MTHNFCETLKIPKLTPLPPPVSGHGYALRGQAPKCLQTIDGQKFIGFRRLGIAAVIGSVAKT